MVCGHQARQDFLQTFEFLSTVTSVTEKIKVSETDKQTDGQTRYNMLQSVDMGAKR